MRERLTSAYGRLPAPAPLIKFAVLTMTDPAPPSQLDTSTRQWLLHYARQCIMAHLSDRPLPSEEGRPARADQKRGCFVSIHTAAGMLRGCVGLFEETTALWRNVQEMALAASSHDPRFVPLGARELATCVLEISALTPRMPASLDQVEVGKHGLWVSRDAFRGVLLPQVASAHHWDRDTFLRQTCIKAGLDADAWEDGSVSLYVFEAEVFSEHGG